MISRSALAMLISLEQYTVLNTHLPDIVQQGTPANICQLFIR